MQFPAWLEIDLDRLMKNVDALRRQAGAGVGLLFVVKADGYGHGAAEVGRAALESGATMLGVATLHEGIELRESGIDGPILVLSPSLPDEFDEILAWDLIPTLSTLDQAVRLSERARLRGRRARVHVEVDTGMGRTGFDADEAFDAIGRIAADPHLDIEGVFTHFSDSDGPDPAFTRSQMTRFEGLLARIEASGLRFRYRHAANSAATLGYPETRLNLIRPGIAVLGVYPSATAARDAVIEPVLSFHSRLVQIRSVPPGRHVSYGGTFVTTRPSRIGVAAVGYGHGLSRLLSNRGQAMVDGRRVPIVGRVTMDLTMIDLTDHPAALVGGEVTLFGRPSECEAVDPPIRIEEVAAWSETIPWEVMCQLDKRVVRRYRRTGRVDKVMTLVGERLEATEGAAAGVIYSGRQRSVHAASTGYWRK